MKEKIASDELSDKYERTAPPRAAAMRAHGLTNILTFNTDDFKRFSGITAVNPQTVK